MQCASEISSRRDIASISLRYRQALLLLLGNDLPHSERAEWWVIKGEKLKSTTVRFTDSDLRLIDSLQDKLGLGMVHVIRLAIRKLAEAENLLPVSSGLKKH